MLKHQKLIEKLTLEEKVALLYSTSKDATEAQKRTGIPSALFAGKECGVIVPETEDGASPTTCFAEPETLARSWDINLYGKVAYCMGNEAAAHGISVLRAPKATVAIDTLEDKKYKGLSEDPYLNGKLISAYVRGVQENDVAVSLSLPDDKENSWIDERALREVYLQPYEMAVKEGKVKALGSSDKLINGEPILTSKHITRGIIRGEWQYSGVISSEGGEGSATERLINGNDLTFGARGSSATVAEFTRAIKKYELYQKALADGSVRKSDYEKALDSGTVLDPALLDEAVDRVIELIRVTRHEPVYDRDAAYSAYPFRHKVVFNEKAHAKVALEAAEGSLVLLKNTAKVLPISADTKVAFVGEIIKRPFSQASTSHKVVATGGESTMMSASKTNMNVVGYAQGYGSGEDEQGRRALLDEAAALATNAETVVVYLGIDENNRAEKSAETGICTLPADQLALLDAMRSLGKRVVAVLVGSVDIDMSWEDKCDALLLAGNCGQAGTKAVLRVLSGEVSPSGKLARTVAVGTRKSATENGIEYRDSIFTGYRYSDRSGEEIKYPFGFGLSYTEFRYSDIRIENDGVSFTLENIGAIDASEVVQLYVGKKDSAVPRADKELKGFEKVFVRAGESCRVHIPFDSKTFRFYNVKTCRWEIEIGAYQILIGSSANDIRLESGVSVNGSSADGIYKKSEIPSYYSGEIGSVDTQEFAKLYNKSVRNGKFYNCKRGKKVPLKLIGLIPVAVAAVIDALVILSAFVPIIFGDLYYMLSSEEKILCGLGLALISGVAIAACVICFRAIGKKKRIESGDATLSQWKAEKYVPDLDYAEDWKPVRISIESADDDESESGSDEAEDIVRDRKSSLLVSVETLCREYCEYARLRGVAVSLTDARQIFAALSATRMIFIKNKDATAAKNALAALGEFLQMKCYFATASENVRTLEDLLTPSSTSDILGVLTDSHVASRAFYVSVLCGVEPDKMRGYFEKFIPFISNPRKKCVLRLGASLVEVADGEADSAVELTRNAYFAAILADGATFDQIDAEIADNSVCIITDITAITDAPVLSAEEAQNATNTYYATVFEWTHRIDNLKEEFYLDETHWRAIDDIEAYLGELCGFCISNKLINRAERFAAVYLAMGGEDDCLDRCIASTVLPSVIGIDKDLLSRGDRKLSDVMLEALDMHGNKVTRAALGEFGIA